MKTIIFACVHNAGRSQMAAAFFNQLADRSEAEAVSAGTEPGVRVHPEVLAAMQEVGIDLSNAKPQRLTEELAKGASLLITMGCGDKCLMFQGFVGMIGHYATRRDYRWTKCGWSATTSSDVWKSCCKGNLSTPNHLASGDSNPRQLNWLTVAELSLQFCVQNPLTATFGRWLVPFAGARST